ncbi:hypothetical protein ABEF93_001203 [Exophiala dermatitidis]
MDSLTLSDDEIVERCQNRDFYPSQLLSDESSGRKILKVSADVVVKFGPGVTHQEASAQQLAFQNVNHVVLRIPQVYRFFTRLDSDCGFTGYLIMENIEGLTLDQLEWNDPRLLERIVAGLNELHAIRSKYPGPVSGGEAHGSLWSEYGSGTPFQHVRDLESYINDRLAYFQTAISMSDEDLCLCHMDVAPRNFMMDLCGRLCLLDWATAGFFHRYFELWAIEFAQHVMGNNFGPELLQKLNATPTEKEGIQKLNLVYRYNSHYTSYRLSDNTDGIMAAVAKASNPSTAISS